jgi:hypothetical protein
VLLCLLILVELWTDIRLWVGCWFAGTGLGYFANVMLLVLVPLCLMWYAALLCCFLAGFPMYWLCDPFSCLSPS